MSKIVYEENINKVMNNIVLFKDRAYCCGCGACWASCPRNAISMVEDEYGNIKMLNQGKIQLWLMQLKQKMSKY